MSCSSRSSSRKMSRASKIVKFFSPESDFYEVDEEQLQPGDLLIFELDSSKDLPFGGHAVVYYGKGKIIHFVARTRSKSGLQWKDEGMIRKEDLSEMSSRKLLGVLRKPGGIDPEVLKRRVQQAMYSDPPRYHLRKNNCVHFAVKLLESTQ